VLTDVFVKLLANMQFLVSREQKEQTGKSSSSSHEKTVSHLADKIHKSLVRGIFPPLPEPQPANNNNKTRQESESVRDLVNNLTHLALAITEDRKRIAAEADEEEDEEGEDDVGHSSAEDDRSSTASSHRRRRRHRGGGSSERTFDSLERKLKRTNLMRRRESQALLDGLRKTRSGGSEAGGHNLALE